MVLAAGQSHAEPDMGAYLAGKQAGAAYDFASAATYFLRALEADPTDAVIADSTISALVGLGRFDETAPIARSMLQAGTESQLSLTALIVADATAGDWAEIAAIYDSGHSVGPFIDGLAQAWALVGLGRVTEALDAFDKITENATLKPFGLFNKALALATVGDFEGAEAILSLTPQDGMQMTRVSVIARAQVLSQLSRNPEAVALIDAAFGAAPDDAIAKLRFRLEAGEPVPFDAVNGPREALGDALFTLSLALDHESDDYLTLVYTRAALALDPANAQAQLLAAELLNRLGRFDLAIETYSGIDPQAPEYLLGQLGRAGVLRGNGNAAEAAAVLEQLDRLYPGEPDVASGLGDAYRALSRWGDAVRAYSQAIDSNNLDARQAWWLFYARGISYERLGDWPSAESDFRRALDGSPEHPQVLNYLGYSLVERRERLDEALDLIGRAVEGQPDNGAIVDSLAWAYYRLGRYDEAVGPMEHAAELLPVDPIINDHLGDIFWAVGRLEEARFQWRRALSFGPDETDATRIRRKLEVGLDQVLQEEGAPPLHPADAAN